MEWNKKVLLVGGTAAAALAVLWYLRKVDGVNQMCAVGMVGTLDFVKVLVLDLVSGKGS